VIVDCLRREPVAAEEPSSVLGVYGLDGVVALVEVDVKLPAAVDGGTWSSRPP